MSFEQEVRRAVCIHCLHGIPLVGTGYWHKDYANSHNPCEYARLGIPAPVTTALTLRREATAVVRTGIPTSTKIKWMAYGAGLLGWIKFLVLLVIHNV